MKKLIYIVLSIMILLTSCVTKNQEESTSNSTEVIFQGEDNINEIIFDNGTDFRFNEEVLLTKEKFSFLKDQPYTLSYLHSTLPISVIHLKNENFLPYEWATSEHDEMTVLHRNLYTVYYLENEELAYVFITEAFEGGNFPFLVGRVIFYPFENKEDEDYIFENVLIKDFPEYLLNNKETRLISPVDLSDIVFEKDILFSYDKETVLEADDFDFLNDEVCTLAELHKRLPLKNLNFTNTLTKLEETTEQVYRNYTVYSLKDEQLCYVFVDWHVARAFPYIVERYIIYPFANEEEKEYVISIVSEGNLPENILARSE